MPIWNYVEVFFVFLISALLSTIILPKILLVSFRRRLFDAIDERKIHHGAVPRLGGYAFFPCVSFAVFLATALHSMIFGANYFADVRVLLLFCALLLIFLMGTMDDLIGVSYRWKFLLQILCGVMLIAAGLLLDNFYGLFGVNHFPEYISIPLTIFVVVFILNALNLIDGIDGLASGLSMVAFLFMGAMLVHAGEWLYAMIAFAGLGVLIPFFYYNVFGRAERGRKIFMGDTGSLTIGMLVAILMIRISMLSEAGSVLETNPLLMALSPIVVPMLDVIRVAFGRIRRGRNPFLPDKTHIHHKFMALGYSQRRSLISILLLSVFFIALNFFLVRVLVDAVWIVVLDIVIWTVFNIALSRKIKKIKGKDAIL